jgi:hypothetical protein
MKTIYTIKTAHKVYEFKTLKAAREFAQFMDQSMVIINYVRKPAAKNTRAAETI